MLGSVTRLIRVKLLTIALSLAMGAKLGETGVSHTKVIILLKKTTTL